LFVGLYSSYLCKKVRKINKVTKAALLLTMAGSVDSGKVRHDKPEYRQATLATSAIGTMGTTAATA
jgi:hypothetical protein